MIQLQNKKGDEKYLSIMMIFIWIMIIVAIVWGAILFYNEQAGVRYQEADILAIQVINCFSEKFNEEALSNFDLYSQCNLNKEVLENSGPYYLSIGINEGLVKNKVYSLDKGVTSWLTNCNYQRESKKIEKNFPQCAYYSSEFLINDKSYVIDVTTASNQK